MMPSIDSGDEMNIDSKTVEKEKRKHLRHFGNDLITRAADMGWEDHEKANLIALIAAELEFRPSQMTKCLQKTNCARPAILAVLGDLGHAFTPEQLVSLFMTDARNVMKFISHVSTAIDSD